MSWSKGTISPAAKLASPQLAEALHLAKAFNDHVRRCGLEDVVSWGVAILTEEEWRARREKALSTPGLYAVVDHV